MKKILLILVLALVFTSAFILISCGTQDDYTVTYMVDGSRYAVRASTGGNKIENPDNPEKRGYSFAGWYTSSQNIWNPTDYTGSDITVEARWETVEYTATFKNGEETVGEVKFDVFTESITEPALPSKPGYFSLWEEYSLDYYDITVNVRFFPITYNITYVLNNENAVHVNKDSYTIESEAFGFTDPISEDGGFLGWYADADFKNPAPERVESGSMGDITLYARWNCSHEYVYSAIKDPGIFTEGIGLFSCIKCPYNYEEVIPATKSVKILAIGNSFSIDALEHLYGILKDGGVENIKIANLYIGGCSLDKHWSCMQSNASDYDLYLSDDTEEKMIKESDKASVKYAIELEDWDYITIQQNSGGSGIIEKYKNLENVISYVKENSPKSKLLWHMTWAYQSDYSGLSSYENSQAVMYSSILNAVNTLIVGNQNIHAIIPSGTAIQNLRTSYLGDTLTRDGYHLSYGIGRYTAALTWFALICGAEVDEISWTPSKYPEIEGRLDAIKEAVRNAILRPFEVTDSIYPSIDDGEEDNIPPTPPAESTANLSELISEDKAYLEGLGLDPSGYKLLTITVYENQYYIRQAHLSLLQALSQTNKFKQIKTE